jgi:hypothetical protein
MKFLVQLVDVLLFMAKVLENMTRAEKRDACVGQKFWFRKDFLRPDGKDSSAQAVAQQAFHRSMSRMLNTLPEVSEEELVVVAAPVAELETSSDVAVEMTLDEIFNGKVMAKIVESY